MRITLHESVIDRLPDLGAAWTRCLAGCPSGQRLFTFEWYRAWLETTIRSAPWSGQVWVVQAEDAHEAPTAFLPLAMRLEHGFRMLSLAGLYQPMRTFICTSRYAAEAPASIATSLLGLRSRWDILRLDPFDLATPERAALVESFARHTRVLKQPRGRTIVHHIREQIDDYAEDDHFKRMLYYERRWLKESTPEIRFFDNPPPSIVASMLGDLCSVEKSSWLSDSQGDLRFASPQDQAFWARVISDSLSPAGQFHTWIAYLNGAPIAFRVTLTVGTSSYLIANQYDQRYAKLSLGWVLYLHHLRFALARGIQTIDMAPGDLHYKGKLGGEEAEMRYGIYVFSPTVRGAAAAAAFNAIVRLRALLARSPRTAALARYLPRV